MIEKERQGGRERDRSIVGEKGRKRQGEREKET